MSRLTRRARVSLLLVLAVVLSACASVPTSGPVEQGELVEVQTGGTFVRVIARPPAPDMSPVEIVRGFLESQASRDANFAVAREYLTPIAAESWDPNGGIEVYDGAGATSPGVGNQVTFLAPTYLRIDAQGRPKVPSATSFSAAEFKLSRIGGQWRISNPPRGLLLSRGDLTRGYRGYSLWFPDPNGEVLVPDTVVVPLALEGLATSLTQALLAGPSSWLAPAVRTAFPPNTALSLDAVTVIDGVAKVPLSPAVLSANNQDRALLSAQLGKTLSSLPDVDAVEILVSGQLLEAANAGGRVGPTDWLAYAPQPGSTSALVIADDRPARVTQAGLRSITADLPSNLPELSVLSQFEDKPIYAGLTTNRRSLVVVTSDRNRSREINFKTVLSAPRFDRFGLIWLASADAIWVVDPTSDELVAREVFGLPADINLLSVLPAADGARVLMRAQDATGFFLALAGIVRDESLSISGFHRVDRETGRTLSVGWQDQTTVIAVQELGSSREVVAIDLVRGQSALISNFAEAVSLAASNGRPTLVATENGDLYRQVGADWVLIGTGSAPTYPG